MRDLPSLLDQPIIAFVLPPRVSPGVAHPEEVVWIGIVSHPTPDECVRRIVRYAFHVSLEFNCLWLSLDPQILLPLSPQELACHSGEGIDLCHQFNDRKACATCVASLREQISRAFNIVRKANPGRVPWHCRWNEATQSGRCLSLQLDVSECFPVGGQDKRSAHQLAIKRRPSGDKSHIGSKKLRHREVLSRKTLTYALDLAWWSVGNVKGIRLTGLEPAQCFLQLPKVQRDKVQPDLFHIAAVLAMVARVANHVHGLATAPPLQQESPIADDVFRRGPGLAVLLHDVARHRISSRVSKQVQEVARWLFQVYDQSVGIQGANPYLLAIVRLPLMKSRAALDVVEQARVL